MGEVLAAAGIVLATLWLVVLVHEGGHYLAGLCVGVPARAMRLVWERPPHVALRDGARWLGPDDDGYVTAFLSHAPGARRAWMFLAGGFLVETVAVLAVALAAQGLGALPVLVLATSTALFVLYLLADVVGSHRSATPYGDGRALWQLTAVGTLALLTTLLAARVALLLSLS